MIIEFDVRARWLFTASFVITFSICSAARAADCNSNGVDDLADIAAGTASDCDFNDIPDTCDISSGSSFDCDHDLLVDQCEPTGHGFALSLDGMGSYVYVGNGFNLSEGFTLEAWVYTQDSNTKQVILTKRQEIPIAGYSFFVQNQKLVFTVLSRHRYESATSVIPEREWTHVAVAFGVNVEFFINGELVDSQPRVEVVPSNSGDVFFGAAPTLQSEYWAGFLDEIRVWDRLLLSPELAAGMNTEIAPSDPDLIGYWRFNAGSGLFAVDEVSGANGFLANGAGWFALAPDCDFNGTPDACDIDAGSSDDCNSNGIPDTCDFASGASFDCNSNSIPDECDINAGASADCNGNGVPDTCELADGTGVDCNSNGTLDACDIDEGTSADCNGNGTPDACELAGRDCNTNSVPDECDIAAMTASDCDSNSVPDECEFGLGAGTDCNTNGIPDGCEVIPSFIEHSIAPRTNPRFIVADDFDGDGDQDIAAVGAGLTWYQNTNGAGNFGAENEFYPIGQGIQDFQTGDPDSDGDADIILGQATLYQVFGWLENEKAYQIAVPPRLIGDPIAYAISPLDVDGDGDQDIAAVTNELSWYENTQGLGGFGEPHLISTSTPTDIESADLDGDGDVDLVTNRIAWFQNTNGLGAFGFEIVIATNGSRTIQAGDVDADGDLDILAIANVFGDDVIVWHENTNGAGGFGPQIMISTIGERSTIIRAADMDMDGDVDVVHASQQDDIIAWYESTDVKATRFGKRRIISTSMDGPQALFLSDIDGDGDVDVIAGSNEDDRIAWFENTLSDCNGNQIPDSCEAQLLDCNMNGRPDECELRGGRARDCNANGIPDECDIANGATEDCNFNDIDDCCETANDCDGNKIPDECDLDAGTSVDCDLNFIPDGCDTRVDFGEPAFVFYIAQSKILDVAVADIDGDSDSDIVSTDFFYGSLWFENTNGIGGFRSRWTTSLGGVDGASALKLIDVNNDDSVDLVVGSIYDNKISWNPNRGDGVFLAKVTISEEPIANVVDTDRVFLDAGDVDGDGDVDVVSSASSDDVIAWYPNTNGFGGFGPRQILGSVPDPRGVRLVDVDGDNDLDVITVSEANRTLIRFLNTNGDGDFGPAIPIATYGVAPWWVDIADLDGDLDQDILVACPAGIIAWHSNISTSGVFSQAISLFEGAFGASKAIPVDLDRDGDWDVVSSSTLDHTVRWYENLDGAATFAFPVDLPPLLDAGPVATADIDGDGDLDMVGASREDFAPRIVWFANEHRDCNRNAIPDSCDIAAFASIDCNSNAVIDSCEPFKAGDFDGDALVDTADWSSFAACLGGPDQGVSGEAVCPGLCIAAFDADADGDLDLRDFAEFVRRFDIP